MDIGYSSLEWQLWSRQTDQSLDRHQSRVAGRVLTDLPGSCRTLKDLILEYLLLNITVNLEWLVGFRQTGML